MSSTILFGIVVIAVVIAAMWWFSTRAAVRQRELDDAKAEARRWVERLGGQVLNLLGTTEAAKQALADAAERHTAAGSQMEQANSVEQCRLTTQTALEGLYYVRAARLAMDMDPGPELPDLAGQRGAGKVTETREVEVEGRNQVASPEPTERTPHYYPGGRVAGRPVPQGWYSEPWWKPALAAGMWGAGSYLLFSSMFIGMAGIPDAAYAEGFADGQDFGGDAGGQDFGDAGGMDFGGFDGGFGGF